MLSVSLDYGMTALVAIISGQLQVSLQMLKMNVLGGFASGPNGKVFSTLGQIRFGYQRKTSGSGTGRVLEFATYF